MNDLAGFIFADVSVISDQLPQRRWYVSDGGSCALANQGKSKQTQRGADVGAGDRILTDQSGESDLR